MHLEKQIGDLMDFKQVKDKSEQPTSILCAVVLTRKATI